MLYNMFKNNLWVGGYTVLGLYVFIVTLYCVSSIDYIQIL